MKIFSNKSVYAMIGILLVSLSVIGYWGVKAKPATANTQKSTTSKDKTYTLEQDDALTITVTDVNVSGKTFDQIKKEMREEAIKNGGILGD